MWRRGRGEGTVRDLVHPPVDVDVQDVDQLVSACGVRIAADTGEKLVHVDVVAHDRVQDPFCSRGSQEPDSWWRRRG